MRNGQVVVDTHFHVWEIERPDRPRLRGPSSTSKKSGAHPVEEMIRTLDAAGVDFGIQVTPSLIGFDNRYSLEAAKAYPHRLFVIGLFNLLEANPGFRLTEWLGNREARGIRLMFFDSPLEADADSAFLEPFWRAAEDLGVPVGVYAPADLARLLTVLDRHRDLRLHIDHLGLDLGGDATDPFANVQLYESFARFPTVTVKVSGLPSLSKEQYPFADTFWVIQRALEAFGPNRLMWGSNYPTLFDNYSYDEAAGYLWECPFLSAQDRDSVMQGTAAEVFGITSPASRTSD